MSSLRILLSYHYYPGDLHALFAKHFSRPYPDTFADSGAFSAKTKGTPINLDAYTTWLHVHRDLLSVYANLDVIGDADATWRNQQRLEAAGLAPLPVFHAGEDWSWLHRYLDNGYRYIALGGLVGRPIAKVMPWAIRCFKIAAGRAVFHGFGLTTWKALAGLPWYSVDSSSWGAGFRFGQVTVFDERAGRWHKLGIGNHREVYALAPLLRRDGYDPADFADRARYDRTKVCGLAAWQWIKAERYLRRRHGPIHLPGAPDGPRPHLVVGRAALGDATAAQAGLRIHLVDGSPDNLGRADRGIHVRLAADQIKEPTPA